MLLSVDLRDYMLTNPIKIKADENLLDAMGLIIDNKVSGVCVVDTQGMLVGVLSEMDCLNAVLDATYNEGSMGCVQDYMTRDHILSAKPSDDIIDIAQDMLVHKHRRRPVVENGKLVGQITCRQLLSAVKKFNR